MVRIIAAIFLLGIALPGRASSADLGPGWAIQYDLADSYITAEDCFGTSCRDTPPVTQQGGGMVIYLEDPDGDGVFEDGAGARIIDFGIDLFWIWESVNAEATWSELHAPSFSQERADGAFDSKNLQIVWESGLPTRSLGEWQCNVGGFCEFALDPTPPAPPTPVDVTKIQDLSALQYNIVVSPPDALIDMVLDLEAMGLPLTDFLAVTLHVVGEETDRNFCGGLVVESEVRGAVASALPGRCIPAPEPDGLVLQAAALVAIAMFRRRRTRSHF